ncbi:L-shaped tail fiber protein [Microcystis phage vB_MweS-yong2]|nr:L-shaped tail fiber protein [Microcystis phage vB_MweS-yong2]
MPTCKDLQAWKGNPFSLVLRFRDADGSYLDLTGRSLRFYATWQGGQMELAPGSGWTLADQTQPATRGQSTLALTKAEVLALPLGDGARYEIELDDRTWLYGKLVVSQWAHNNA